MLEDLITPADTPDHSQPVHDITVMVSEPPQWHALVVEYKGFQKAAAGGVIRMADTLYRAKKQLSAEDFARFCEAVHLDPRTSTFRKLMKIGENAPWLERYSERLPSSWTTLYKITTLANDERDKLVKDERLSPLTTAKEVADLVRTRPIHKPISTRRDVTLDFSKVPDSDLWAAYNWLLDGAAQRKIDIRPSREFEQRTHFLGGSDASPQGSHPAETIVPRVSSV
jgi:hypothetical protein